MEKIKIKVGDKARWETPEGHRCHGYFFGFSGGRACFEYEPGGVCVAIPCEWINEVEVKEV